MDDFCFLDDVEEEMALGENSEDEEMGLEENSEDEESFATPAKKKGSYTLLRKLEVVDYSNRNSVHSAAKKFSVTRSRVQEWRKQEARLRQQL